MSEITHILDQVTAEWERQSAQCGDAQRLENCIQQIPHFAQSAGIYAAVGRHDSARRNLIALAALALAAIESLDRRS